jgi:phage-related minor tail protein
LEIILEARDEASKVLGGLSGSLGSLGGVAGAVATGGLALVGAAVAGIGAGAVVAGKQVLDFTADTNEAMRNFQAQVGASEEEMAGFREQALDVFESGYGESVGDISGAMAGVNQVLGETGDQLEESTRRALILRDTFELDVQEGVSIAAAAVKSGLAENSEEAFDLITKGFQEGLNQAGDFGDTIREYSSDFERLGFTTQEVLGVLNAGLEEGAYNTDVVADGIREFGIRFGAAEESALTALDAIGINSEELYAKYQAGEITVADAMATITGALGQVENKTLQAQAGAALFGSKWEDVGGDVFMALSPRSWG